MTQQTLEERVECLEDGMVKLENLPAKIDNLSKSMNDFMKNVGTPHFCKWNGTIGQVQQFMVDTPDQRKRMFEIIERHEKDIDGLKVTVSAVKENKAILTDMVNNLEKDRKERKMERERSQTQFKISNRQIIYTFVGGLLVGILILVLDKYFL